MYLVSILDEIHMLFNEYKKWIFFIVIIGSITTSTNKLCQACFLVCIVFHIQIGMF